MSSKLAMIVLALVSMLAACGGGGGKSAPAEGPTAVKLVACDDGGSGGVVIDGVCL